MGDTLFNAGIQSPWAKQSNQGDFTIRWTPRNGALFSAGHESRDLCVHHTAKSRKVERKGKHFLSSFGLSSQSKGQENNPMQNTELLLCIL